MLIDTDVVIDYLRGRTEAADFFERNIDDAAVSTISVAELFQGVRDGREREILSEALSALIVLPVTASIAETAGLYRRDYRQACGCGLADCIIAATASHHRLPLATRNVRHFVMLDEVRHPYEG